MRRMPKPPASEVPALLATIHQPCFPPLQAWSKQSFSELLVQPSVQLYQHETCGFLLTRTAADEMEILTIAVLPSHQRRGIATRLMQQALSTIEHSMITRCFLEVEAQNQPAISCYKRLNFEVIATRKDYYQNEQGRSDALVMQRAI